MSKDSPWEYLETAKSFYGKNEVAANIYIRKAAMHGCEDAWFMLAQRFVEGIPYKDEDKAYKCLQVAQRMGSFKASTALSLLTHVPVFCDKPFFDNMEDAIHAAIERSNTEPALQLSVIAGLDCGASTTGLDDEEGISVLKDIAAVGDVLAAMDLNMAYYHEAIFSHDKAHYEGAYFWGLIENYLWGHESWDTRSISYEVLSEDDNAQIIKEAREWIKSHPLAKSTHNSWSYRKELKDGRVDVDWL